jgi:hypothetical protein
MKGTLQAIMLVILATSACVGPATGKFAIYLPQHDISARKLSSIDLDALPLQQEPILSQDDIVTYMPDTYQILLTPKAAERINGLEVPVGGRAFVVCVGRDRIYGGAFWTPISSYSFEGIVIMVPVGEDDLIQFSQGYPAPSHFRGEDPRPDPRILHALQAAGKCPK